MISIMKFSKAHNSVKNVDGIRLLFSANCLVMLYICTEFLENISKVTGHDFHSEFFKGP